MRSPVPLAAAYAVDVFANEIVAGIGTPGAQVAELVLGVLAFVLSRYPGIDRNAHMIASLGWRDSVSAWVK